MTWRTLIIYSSRERTAVVTVLRKPEPLMGSHWTYRPAPAGPQPRFFPGPAELSGPWPSDARPAAWLWLPWKLPLLGRQVTTALLHIPPLRPLPPLPPLPPRRCLLNRLLAKRDKHKRSVRRRGDHRRSLFTKWPKIMSYNLSGRSFCLSDSYSQKFRFIGAANSFQTKRGKKKLKFNKSIEGRNVEKHKAAMSFKSWTLWWLNGYNRG